MGANFNRVVLIVLDGLGIGAMPDAELYNDRGAHTLRHVARHVHGLYMPNMAQLGLGNIESVEGILPADIPKAYHGRMLELSMGKDTTTGHWEIMGIYTKEPFPTYPDGFPSDLIQSLEEQTGRKIVGNRTASGTEIIAELGRQHVESGNLIVYTSADSVLQIAAHERVIPISELYDICKLARKLTSTGNSRVTRIIARPFDGEFPDFERTSNRRDYSIKPPSKTVLNYLQEAGLDVIGIGKISDIYADEGITRSTPTRSNMDGMDHLINVMAQDYTGLCFLNLVDFDAKYGHRRDPVGYAKALEEFDARLPEVFKHLREQDLLLITADHGNDPVHPGTDHTREYVPLLAYSKCFTGDPISLGVRETFADIGATIADNFGIQSPAIGRSFLKELN